MKDKKDTGVKVVLPQWWQDSVNIHIRLDEKPYELPNPLILSGKQFKEGPASPSSKQRVLFEDLNHDLKLGR
jgi:hypothetical protein